MVECSGKARDSTHEAGHPDDKQGADAASDVLNYASKHRWVDSNAGEHVERLSDTRSPDEQAIDGNILSPDEIRRLLDAMPEGVYRMIVQTAAFTGARQSELLALQEVETKWVPMDVLRVGAGSNLLI